VIAVAVQPSRDRERVPAAGGLDAYPDLVPIVARGSEPVGQISETRAVGADAADRGPLPAAIGHARLIDGCHHMVAATHVDTDVQALGGRSRVAPSFSQGCNGGLCAQWSSCGGSELRFSAGKARMAGTCALRKLVVG